MATSLSYDGKFDAFYRKPKGCMFKITLLLKAV